MAFSAVSPVSRGEQRHFQTSRKINSFRNIRHRPMLEFLPAFGLVDLRLPQVMPK